MEYFFILGKTPLLSFIEIKQILDKSKFQKISKHVLLTNSINSFNIKDLQKRLGGTVKIGKILGRYSKNDLKNKDFISKVLKQLDLDGDRINFGFSLYGDKNNSLDRLIKKVALKIKKIIKRKDISCRWVTSKKRILSSVILIKNDLLQRGAEIIVVPYHNKFIIGKTVTCQNFEKYSFYDYSKPKRPIKKGILPFKLAKIMVNFALNGNSNFKNFNLIDPFCGSGTILISALLLGLKNIYGSDKDNQAVLNSKTNLNWAANNSEITLNKGKIFKSDVENISQNIHKKFNLIVTEPFLGPLKIKDVNLQIKNISQLYIKAFSEFEKIIKNNGRVVMIFPVFKKDNKKHFLPILNTLQSMGWQQDIDFSTFKGPYNSYLSQRNTLIYYRPGQKVLREILIFSYNK